MASDPAAALFRSGPWSPECDAYQSRVRKEVAAFVVPHFGVAEATNKFPRAVLERLGEAGHFRERWATSGLGDLGRATVFFYELGRQLMGGVALGISLHLESALAVARRSKLRIGPSSLYEQMLDGSQIGCIAITEPTGGSNVEDWALRAERVPEGWRLAGRKKFISLARTADWVFTLARTGDDRQFSFFAVPMAQVTIKEVLNKLGTRSLETCVLEFADVLVGEAHLIGRLNDALPLVFEAMTNERLAGAATLLGHLETCISLAAAYLKARPQGDGVAWKHQALRHRIADAISEHKVLWDSCRFTAWRLQHGRANARDVAALKLQVAPRVERMLSELLQLFGGAGYIDEWPLERVLRDARIARIGGGTDEMMREILATWPLTDVPFRTWLREGRVEPHPEP